MGKDTKKLEQMMYWTAKQSAPYGYFMKFISDYIKEGDTVVDVGCGLGLTFGMLEEFVGEKGRIIGVDFSISALKDAKKHFEKAECVRATGTSLPLKDDSADVVTSTETIQYAVMLKEDAEVDIAREMYRITKPGGMMISHYMGLELLELMLDLYRKYDLWTEDKIKKQYDIVDGKYVIWKIKGYKMKGHSAGYLKKMYKKLRIPIMKLEEDYPPLEFFDTKFLFTISDSELSELRKKAFSHIVYVKKPE
jgi:ubiquinone/menaquinone biosynthesis C-methylase UbiE